MTELIKKSNKQYSHAKVNDDSKIAVHCRKSIRGVEAWNLHLRAKRK